MQTRVEKRYVSGTNASGALRGGSSGLPGNPGYSQLGMISVVFLKTPGRD